MVSTPVRSWGRPTAVVSGAAVMVGLAGAWLTPATADPARPASLGAGPNATVPVRLVSDVTPMVSAWPAAGLGGRLGGGPGGGPGGSGGDAVAPSPGRHSSESGSSSSSSGGSVSRPFSSSSSPSSEGPVQTAFNTVGRWLGFSRHSSEGSGSDHDSAAVAPKPAKHAAGAGGGSGSGSGGGPDAAASSGVGGLVHSVLSGVGRLIGGLFGH